MRTVEVFISSIGIFSELTVLILFLRYSPLWEHSSFKNVFIFCKCSGATQHEDALELLKLQSHVLSVYMPS